jgi:hypothetical protein
MSNFRFNSADQSTVSRSLPNGGLYSCTVADTDFLTWCGAGNTPEPYVPPAPTQAELNAPHLAYLASTDWYVLRFVDIGIAVPDAITAARQAARASVQ